METSLKAGLEGEAKIQVNENNLAIEMASGNIPVFATPAMIALMEKAAWSSVAQYLAEGQTTVGIKVTCSHIAATPLGMEVVAKTTLTEVDGKRLVFKVEAFDEVEKIGEGVHERFIISTDKFMSRTQNKRLKGQP